MSRKKQGNPWIAIIIVTIGLLVAAGFIFWTVLGANSSKSSESGESRVPATVEEATATATSEERETAAETEDPAEGKAEEQLDSMSTEEKVAQLFFVTPEELTGVDVAVQAGDTTRQSLSDYPVGGIIYFSQNIQSEEQLTDMIQATQSYSEIPLFIGVDEEGGSLVARIANSGLFDVPVVDDMATIGASGDSSQAYDVGTTIGTYLSALGFNVDFAPDSDVLVNPDNTAIGVRSFGPDASVDAEMVAKVVEGLQEMGVSATLKHFPGHGATTTDSHNGAAIVDRSLDELRSTEFLPFSAGIQAGADFVMVGHLEVPQVVSDGTPASLSATMITDLLRGELGFEQIVITDSLSMEAITDYYTPDEAAVQAIQAGADMLLMPSDFTAAYQGVLDAVNNGTISEERLNESVKRILMVKLG
ncbi:MAG: glycoside hydrolase family 3 protein [Lachnospiraceae bacterium]|nr:glycoside hydrolase family 3 protein [Lachnospiraceae bacterium]NCD03918.1 hypothetical protein [Clostridia bacterium]